MTSVPVHIGELFNMACAQCLAVAFSKRFGVLLWMGENDVKTVVWTWDFCYVFSEMKTEVFKKVLMWTCINTVSCSSFFRQVQSHETSSRI